MKVLIVGSGGREHAIAASVAKVIKWKKYIVRREMPESDRLQNVLILPQWNLTNWLILQKKIRLI